MESLSNCKPIDLYQDRHSIYTDPNIPLSPSLQWDLGTIKMPSHDGMYTNP